MLTVILIVLTNFGFINRTEMWAPSRKWGLSCTMGQFHIKHPIHHLDALGQHTVILKY